MKKILCSAFVALLLVLVGFLGADYLNNSDEELIGEEIISASDVVDIIETYDSLKQKDFSNNVSLYDLALAVEGFYLKDKPLVPVEGNCQSEELNESYTYYSCAYPYQDTIHIKNDNFSFAEPIAVTDNSIDKWYVRESGDFKIMTPDL